MNKLLITTAITLSAFAPALGHAMILPEDVVASILGSRNPPSTVTVGTVQNPMWNSTAYWNNQNNVTNRVLNRSIRADIVRVYTNSQNGEIYTTSAIANKGELEKFCQSDLLSRNVKNAVKECNLSK